jgi:hypothetical protein
LKCRDELERPCEFAIVLKTDPMGREIIAVKHAYRGAP